MQKMNDETACGNSTQNAQEIKKMAFKVKGTGSKFCDGQCFGDCNGGNGSWLACLWNGAL
jgi:hypothetical protein